MVSVLGEFLDFRIRSRKPELLELTELDSKPEESEQLVVVVDEEEVDSEELFEFCRLIFITLGSFGLEFIIVEACLSSINDLQLTSETGVKMTNSAKAKT